MTDVKKAADEADVIVNGYAFTRCTEGYSNIDSEQPCTEPPVFSQLSCRSCWTTSTPAIELQLVKCH